MHHILTDMFTSSPCMDARKHMCRNTRYAHAHTQGETCSQCLLRWPGMPVIRNRVGNDWAIAVKDETLLDPIFNHLLQKVQGQGQGQIRFADEVTLHNSQVHIRTRRRISFSAVHDWVSRQMSSFSAKKMWTFQVPKDSPAQCAVEPMTDSQKPFLLQKLLMHATSPLRLSISAIWKLSNRQQNLLDIFLHPKHEQKYKSSMPEMDHADNFEVCQLFPSSLFEAWLRSLSVVYQ